LPIKKIIFMPEPFIFQFFLDPIFCSQLVVILIVSISFHELSHGWAALDQGDDTPVQEGHMTLNPFVHLGLPSIILLFLYGICWGAMPVNPSKFRSEKWGEILVAAAGPLMNLGLAFLFICIHNLMPRFLTSESIYSEFILAFAALAVSVNFGLFIFNLIPAPPLDGFRIFSELVPSFKPLRDSPFGLAILVCLFVVGFPIWEISNELSKFFLR
jgi:Zn-dependent protease